MEKLSMQALGRSTLENFKQTAKLPVTLVLDNVRSGLNVGSIFRSADAFAIEKILLCGITAHPPHREILKTALGSTDSVDWAYVEHAADALNQLKQSGYQIWAVEQTQPKKWLHEFQGDPLGRYALVLGNEVEGVQESVLAKCDGALEIPQFGTKHSLNVAVAAGIVLWEVRKILSGY